MRKLPWGPSGAEGSAARTTTILTSLRAFWPLPLAMASTRAIPAADRLPMTVLTGYLGAGKTTLLNRILTHEHGLKVAVIVNEFGEVGIDNQLVVDADEEILEMNNGCICCTVRGDLIRIIGNLMKRRDRFDHLVIETTGLADPAPVIQTFFVDEDLRDELKLDAVVTLVDLKHVLLHWEAEEVQEQLAFADVLLLNKADLVDESERLAIERRIRAINPMARLLTTRKPMLRWIRSWVWRRSSWSVPWASIRGSCLRSTPTSTTMPWAPWCWWRSGLWIWTGWGAGSRIWWPSEGRICFG